MTPPPSLSPIRKKPAGAVSMFGGVDLFGTSKQSEEASTTPPQAKAAPPQPKVAPKPSGKERRSQSGDGGLFDEGGGDGGDIFSFQPKKK